MNTLKKGDFIIIAAVAAIFVLSFVAPFYFLKDGSQVVIKQNDKIVYSQSIDQNGKYDTGTNLVFIEDGVVFVKSANCKNQVCVKSGKISKKGEKIVCLPNKVIVEIE